MKAIEGYDSYFVDEEGNIFSTRQGFLNQLHPCVCPNGYAMIGLIDPSGKHKKELVHRLVGKAFIPNPQNLPEINHKDKVRNNNRVENLEWSTRMDNLLDSYETMSPVRNFLTCDLFLGNKHIGKFQSICAAARRGKELGFNYYSLEKYLVCGDMRIVPQNGDRRPTIVRKSKQQRGPFDLFVKNELTGTYCLKREAAEAAHKLYGVNAKKLVSCNIHKKLEIEIKPHVSV